MTSTLEPEAARSRLSLTAIPVSDVAGHPVVVSARKTDTVFVLKKTIRKEMGIDVPPCKQTLLFPQHASSISKLQSFNDFSTLEDCGILQDSTIWTNFDVSLGFAKDNFHECDDSVEEDTDSVFIYSDEEGVNESDKVALVSNLVEGETNSDMTSTLLPPAVARGSKRKRESTLLISVETSSASIRRKTIECGACFTVKDLKNALEAEDEKLPVVQDFYFRGVMMDDDKLLAAYNIPNRATMNRIAKWGDRYVRVVARQLSGTQTEVAVERDGVIRQLELSVKRLYGFQHEIQLVLGHEVLDSRQHISHYRIEHNTVVNVVKRANAAI